VIAWLSRHLTSATAAGGGLLRCNSGQDGRTGTFLGCVWLDLAAKVHSLQGCSAALSGGLCALANNFSIRTPHFALFSPHQSWMDSPSTPRTKCNLRKFGRGIKSLHQNWKIGREIPLPRFGAGIGHAQLVLDNLQTMTDPLILPSLREHSQQSVDKDIEQLQGRDASLHYTCIKRACCTVCIVWSQTDCYNQEVLTYHCLQQLIGALVMVWHLAWF